jgi:hypothetical protein
LEKVIRRPESSEGGEKAPNVVRGNSDHEAVGKRGSKPRSGKLDTKDDRWSPLKSGKLSAHRRYHSFDQMFSIEKLIHPGHRCDLAISELIHQIAKWRSEIEEPKEELTEPHAAIVNNVRQSAGKRDSAIEKSREDVVELPKTLQTNIF